MLAYLQGVFGNGKRKSGPALFALGGTGKGLACSSVFVCR